MKFDPNFPINKYPVKSPKLANVTFIDMLLPPRYYGPIINIESTTYNSTHKNNNYDNFFIALESNNYIFYFIFVNKFVYGYLISGIYEFIYFIFY